MPLPAPRKHPLGRKQGRKSHLDEEYPHPSLQRELGKWDCTGKNPPGPALRGGERGIQTPVPAESQTQGSKGFVWDKQLLSRSQPNPRALFFPPAGLSSQRSSCTNKQRKCFFQPSSLPVLSPPFPSLEFAGRAHIRREKRDKHPGEAAGILLSPADPA